MSKISAYLEELEGNPSSHLTGMKKVFLSNEEDDSNLTQFAFGKFSPGESCEAHSHGTMNEYFYFISGSGKYYIGEEVLALKPGTFIKIPAQTLHWLLNDGDEDLTFVYFGVAVE